MRRQLEFVDERAVGLAKPISEQDLRAPPQLALRLRGIHAAALELAWPKWRENGLERNVRVLLQLVEEALHIGLDTGRDVEYPLFSIRGDQCTRDVDDVNVVARRAPEAVDGRRRATPEMVREDCDHTRLAVGALARAVDVAKSANDMCHAVCL